MVSLRRSLRLHRTSWSFLDTSSVDTMSIANSESSTSSRRRDTGFPESFCGNRNTSLPHPDADTSPNACISQEDISPTRVLSRQRRSFLAKNKRTISHGFLAPEMPQMYSDVAVISESEGSPTFSESARLPIIPGTPAVGHSMTRTASGGGDSIASNSTGDHDDGALKPPATRYKRHSRPRMSTDSGISSRAGRRRSFMGRLGLHRNHD